MEINRAFVVVDVDQLVDEALAAASQVDAAFVVVSDRSLGQPRYYVLARTEYERRLAGKSGRSVGRALGLYRMDPAATLAFSSDPHRLASHAVVLDEGHVMGVLEPAVPTRGGSRIASTRPRPTPFNATSPALPGSANATRSATVSRHLVCSLPPEARPDREVSLLVALRSSATPGTVSSGLLQLAVGATIDIVVRAGDGLTLASDDAGALTVTDPQPDEPLLFRFRTGPSGEGHATVYAFCKGRSIAALSLTLTIRPEAIDGAARANTHQAVMVPPGPPPDLSIYVLEQGDELTYSLSSADGRLKMTRYGPVVLGKNVREYFRTFFDDIEHLDAAAAEPDTILLQLAAKGADLFEKVCPEALRLELWSLRDRFCTIQITSSEPWIPWELCRLTGRGADGFIEEGRFLAEYQLTRWLYGVSAAPSLPLRRIALVVPDDSGLESAPKERDYMRSLGRTTREVSEIEPTFGGVTSAMYDGRYDAWHFVGHANAEPGVDADQSSIELRGRERLKPFNLAGRAGNMLRSRPLVFLNACQSGRAGLSLTSLGGWAVRFLKPNSQEAAASAFIGSLWAVDDATALAFATAFYDALLAGSPIGEAVCQARTAIRVKGDTTWLAYTVYADPDARVSA